MQLLTKVILITLSTLFTAHSTLAEESLDKPGTKSLTVGADAPKIDIENWISTAGGKFEPITDFEAGKVYVIEFWATWCGPCKAGMPHLADLQEQYADQGVMVIGVSDEKLDKVTEFLASEVPTKDEAATPQTYGKLTSAYCLASDPDRSVLNDYFRAAGQTGIPCALVVGKDAKVEWVGHPGKMDEVLEQVVADSWDREAFAVKFKSAQLDKKLKAAVNDAVNQGDVDGMALLIDKLKNLEVGDEFSATVDKHIQTLEGVMEAKALTGDPDAAIAKIAAGELSYRGMNTLATELIKSGSNGEVVSAELASALGKALDVKLADVPDRGANLLVLPSKLGRVAELYYLGGDIDQAIAIAEKSMDIQDKNIEKVAEQRGDKATRLLKILRRGTMQKLKKYVEAKAASEDGVAAKPSEA